MCRLFRKGKGEGGVGGEAVWWKRRERGKKDMVGKGNRFFFVFVSSSRK